MVEFFSMCMVWAAIIELFFIGHYSQELKSCKKAAMKNMYTTELLKIKISELLELVADKEREERYVYNLYNNIAKAENYLELQDLKKILTNDLNKKLQKNKKVEIKSISKDNYNPFESGYIHEDLV